MDQQNTATSRANGTSTTHDLFALTDEQILEIEPTEEVASDPSTPLRASEWPFDSAQGKRVASENHTNVTSEAVPSKSISPREESSEKQPSVQPGASASQVPPQWLAEAMNDPQRGASAKEFWNGVQQAQQEAAAYRAAFATPEEARALKELYPGGVNEARTAADRARVLDEIDHAYFAGDTQQRSQLAATMLREDPAAFREMVFAGLRVLEAVGKTGEAHANAFQATDNFRESQVNARPLIGATLGSPASGKGADVSSGGASPAPTSNPNNVSDGHSQLAAYAAFEAAANRELEQTVGGAIERALLQALPSLSQADRSSSIEAQHAAPLQERLSGAVRQDVEQALKGDRQLGEQVAPILSSRRWIDESRAQVVRLIGERARQLVPSATKRVLQDWTQTTLAAHRGTATRREAAASRREVEVASSPAAISTGIQKQRGRSEAAVARPDSRRIDYRKLSDEQILGM